MMNQRSNTDVKAREYVGNFSNAFMGLDGKKKHSLEVHIKVDGTVCVTLHYLGVSDNQTQHSIMLTNEQRKNLSEFLGEIEPVLWQDLSIQ